MKTLRNYSAIHDQDILQFPTQKIDRIRGINPFFVQDTMSVLRTVVRTPGKPLPLCNNIEWTQTEMR